MTKWGSVPIINPFSGTGFVHPDTPVQPTGGGGGGGGTTNEPVGMTVISNRPYNALFTEGWDEPTNGQSQNNVSIQQDAGALKTPPNYLQVRYLAGSGGGGAPWDADSPGFLYKTLYVSTWIRVSANWQGHPGSSVNKMYYCYTSTDVPSFYTYLNGANAGPLVPFVGGQNVTAGGNGFGDPQNPDWPPNLSPGFTITRGQWFNMEVVAKMNSASSTDGFLDMWINGTKIMHISGITWQNSSPNWRSVHMAPVWGGGGGVVANTMFMDWDHIYCSGK